MYLDSGSRPTLTPKLAMRVAILGGIALLAFAIIFFRLWYLQVLSGDTYRAEANDNRVREITVQAPRGEIVDREGRVLVGNRVGWSVQVAPNRLPESEAARLALYRRLGRVLSMRPQRIRRSIEPQLEQLPYGAATVKKDVRTPIIAHLLENQDDFPGVTVERVFMREYPHDSIGAHLVGHVGEVTEDQLSDGTRTGVTRGDRIGQDGIELEYDRFLRGRNGATRVEVDALGRLREQLGSWVPKQGRQLRLAVDLQVQRTGQTALAGVPGPGAFVAMNINNGEILGLGSSPSFDPSHFSRDYNRLSRDELAPLTNRGTQGGYPTGSTFKLITAVAALEGGLITPEEVQYDPGFIVIGNQDYENAGRVAHGPVALRRALSVSSDVYFYRLGLEANGTGDGLLIQRWARKLGLGRPTGIDLPGEAAGVVPTPKWREETFKGEWPWVPGDNVNLSVGQGDLQASPLQMAVAYAAVANGGRVVQPRLGQRIEDSTGRPLQELEAPPSRRVEIAPAHRQAIMEGLRAAASEPEGTSQPVFAGFAIDVAGKTGTAEKGAGRPDQSWYVALAPYPSPKYVVVTTFETGGFGAATAAPAARSVLSALFDVDDSGEAPVGSAQD